MHLQILTIIPALATIAWALTAKLKEKKIFDACVLFASAIAVITNGLVIYFVLCTGQTPAVLHFIQTISSAAIVPLAYMYFAHQMGRKWNNLTAVFCWVLMLFTLVPNINIFLGEMKAPGDPSQIQIFRFNVFNDGRLVFSTHIADLVIMIQALLTVARMIPTAMTMKKYGLILSKRMEAFFIWWIAAVIFIAVTSFTTLHDITTPVGSWIYYISYTLLVCSIYSLLAMRFDLNPVVTKDSKEVVRFDEFIDASKEMASKLKVLISKDKIYLQEGYSAEDAAIAIGTNRTYFSRMMNVEFGMKFSDLMNQYRINEAKMLLATTDNTIADIALESGFSDASYMNRKFRQIVGVTPRNYRIAHNGESGGNSDSEE